MNKFETCTSGFGSGIFPESETLISNYIDSNWILTHLICLITSFAPETSPSFQVTKLVPYRILLILNKNKSRFLFQWMGFERVISWKIDVRNRNQNRRVHCRDKHGWLLCLRLWQCRRWRWSSAPHSPAPGPPTMSFWNQVAIKKL